jgi:hypothetical protein
MLEDDLRRVLDIIEPYVLGEVITDYVDDFAVMAERLVEILDETSPDSFASEDYQ